ncbi:hypothetical protein [Marimonas lutisalis]|uniref:hypothetical protein n=1 Tax=Marimonas lutisalis TaxID=2545756 RepID=UPI0010F49D89|nr:hypothetical protein [Marimonas lutisalis]
MTRILIHAGFYKTGTSSVQAFLAQNRSALAPYFDFYGPGDIGNSGQYAREYAQRPFPWRLYRFRRALRRFLAGIPDPASGTVVISRENYTGVMPGHRDWRGRPVIGFPAAEKLLATLLGELRHRFGPEAQIEFLFTTRTRESWLKSVHGHLLRSIRLTDDLDTFIARFPAGFSPAAEVARLARVFAPIPVHATTLDELMKRREGPAAAVLDIARVPQALRDSLPDPRPVNIGQSDELRARFLELNRSRLSRAALKAEKEALLRNS